MKESCLTWLTLIEWNKSCVIDVYASRQVILPISKVTNFRETASHPNWEIMFLLSDDKGKRVSGLECSLFKAPYLINSPRALNPGSLFLSPTPYLAHLNTSARALNLGRRHSISRTLASMISLSLILSDAKAPPPPPPHSLPHPCSSPPFPAKTSVLCKE